MTPQAKATMIYYCNLTARRLRLDPDTRRMMRIAALEHPVQALVCYRAIVNSYRHEGTLPMRKPRGRTA